MTRLTIVAVAQACHAINAAYVEAIGDTPQKPWDELPQEIRQSAINGVALHLTDPHLSPAASHEAWMLQKTREGWKYGEVKDFEAKTHPCYRPYDELPAEQRAKDYLFKATVAQFRPHMPGGELAKAAELAQAFHNPPANNETTAEQVAAHAAKLTYEELEKMEPVQGADEPSDAFAQRHTDWQQAMEAALDAAINGGETAPKTPSVENNAGSA